MSYMSKSDLSAGLRGCDVSHGVGHLSDDGLGDELRVVHRREHRHEHHVAELKEGDNCKHNMNRVSNLLVDLGCII